MGWSWEAENGYLNFWKMLICFFDATRSFGLIDVETAIDASNVCSYLASCLQLHGWAGPMSTTTYVAVSVLEKDRVIAGYLMHISVGESFFFAFFGEGCGRSLYLGCTCMAMGWHLRTWWGGKGYDALASYPDPLRWYLWISGNSIWEYRGNASATEAVSMIC